jgi:hypothetical protein
MKGKTVALGGDRPSLLARQPQPPAKFGQYIQPQKSRILKKQIFQENP